MTQEEILKRVNKVFINVLDNTDIIIKPETVAADIEEWDSLTHILLIVETEKHFNIRFTSEEIRGFQNVGDMCSLISRKLKG